MTDRRCLNERKRCVKAQGQGVGVELHCRNYIAPAAPRAKHFELEVGERSKGGRGGRSLRSAGVGVVKVMLKIPPVTATMIATQIIAATVHLR
jgi:hypothetical protein